MFANHHFGLAPYRPPQQPRMQSDTLKSAEVQIDHKVFIVSLKENIRGRCLVITEIHRDRKNMVLIPQSGLAEFSNLLGEMVKTESELPGA